MFYLLLTILLVFFSGYLFKKGCGTISLSQLNMMSVIFYYYLLLQSVIGSVLVVNQIDNHYMIDKLTHVESRYYGYAAIMYTIIAFPIGMIIANRLWGIRNISQKFNRYCQSKIDFENKYNDKIVKYICIVVSFIAFCATLYVTAVIGEISIIKALGSSSAVELAGFRADSTRHFMGNEYVKNILALGMTPLMSYVAYAYKLRNNTRFNKIWFWLMFATSIQIVSYNLEKAPIVVYLIGFLFFRIYLGKYISKRQLIILAIMIILLVIGLYMLIMGSGIDVFTLFTYNSGIIGRLTLSSVAGLFHNFDLWPDVNPFIGFSSLSQVFSEFIGIPYTERASRLIMETVNPEGIKMGFAGVVNSLFVGEAWSNWGIWGVVLSPLIVGGMIQSLYIFFLKSPKTPFFLALFVNFSFKSSITGGVNDYLYNIQAIIIICLILSIYGFSKVLNKSLRYEKKNDISHSAGVRPEA